jgi:hypothetical protein
VTLRLGERAGTEEQALDNRLPAFIQKFPNGKVEREVSTGDMIQDLRTMATSNTLPDAGQPARLHRWAGVPQLRPGRGLGDSL